jgi:phosphoribosyl 1,2-cyclic phosphodiesterase
MNFTPLASSSKGNAYLVTSPGVAPLLLEAGIPIKSLREKLHFGLSELAGCLISHLHGDHSKAVKDLLKSSVDCCMAKETAEALGVESHHRTHFITPEFKHTIKGWAVRPFALEHDVPCLGFFIEQSGERLLFIPDTGYVRNRFQGVNIVAIECNHLEEKLSENILNGSLPAVVGHRIRRNHLSLERFITMLKSNNLSRCRQIHLLHLSDGNSDERKMILEVQKATGIPTYSAGE